MLLVYTKQQNNSIYPNILVIFYNQEHIIWRSDISPQAHLISLKQLDIKIIDYIKNNKTVPYITMVINQDTLTIKDKLKEQLDLLLKNKELTINFIIEWWPIDSKGNQLDKIIAAWEDIYALSQ